MGPEIVQLVTIAKQISEATSGCYDLTIAPLFSLWGFRDQQLTIPNGHNLPHILVSTQLISSQLSNLPKAILLLVLIYHQSRKAIQYSV
ncbi:FAD:protein FMN transferase [Pseudoalteromonas nigrifaciens]|nr:FAD:protein FMN transferase [Pseudoalteromonas nigrifaciens]